MFITRSPGVQATRVMQEQNRKEQRQTMMMCNDIRSPSSPTYTPSPRRYESLPSVTSPQPAAAVPAQRLTMDAQNFSSTRLPFLNGSSPSVSPTLSSSLSPRRPISVVSPSRRTFHMTPNERRKFYQGFVDMPSNATVSVKRNWQA